jgi:hypothetical protein
MYGPSTGVLTHRWMKGKGVWPQDVQRTDSHRQEKQTCKHFSISINLDGMVKMRSEGKTISIITYIAVKTISIITYIAIKTISITIYIAVKLYPSLYILL